MESGPTTTAQAVFCSGCGTRLSNGARFCHRCGTAAGEAPVVRGAGAVLPWTVAALALVALLALLAGQFYGRRQSAATTGAASPAQTQAPDISRMSPQERADRL